MRCRPGFTSAAHVVPTLPVAVAVALVSAALSGCASPAPPPAPIRVDASPPPSAAVGTARSSTPDPPLPLAEARAHAAAWQLAWSKVPDRLDHDVDAAFAAANKIDEVLVRPVLTALTGKCLFAGSPEASACKILEPSPSADAGIRLAVELAGELAAPIRARTRRCGFSSSSRRVESGVLRMRSIARSSGGGSRIRRGAHRRRRRSGITRGHSWAMCGSGR